MLQINQNTIPYSFTTAPSGSLTCSVNSTDIQDLDLTYPNDLFFGIIRDLPHSRQTFSPFKLSSDKGDNLPDSEHKRGTTQT